MRPCQGRSRGFESRFPLHPSRASCGWAESQRAPDCVRPDRYRIHAYPIRLQQTLLIAVSSAAGLPCSSRAFRAAPSPSGKAEVCKTSIPGSNPGGASNLRSCLTRRLSTLARVIGLVEQKAFALTISEKVFRPAGMAGRDRRNQPAIDARPGDAVSVQRRRAEARSGEGLL